MSREPPRMFLSVLWSRTLRAAAAVGLTIGSVANQDPLWWWLVPLGVFIVASESISGWRDRNRNAVLQVVDQRVVRAIADLGAVSGDNYDFWIIEVYLLQWTWTSTGPARRLVRQPPLALTDVQALPAEVPTSGDGAFAASFRTRKPAVWWDLQFGPTPTKHESYTTQFDHDQTAAYGAISVSPLADRTGRDCRGVLVVQTKPDPLHVTAAVGVFRSPEGRRRIADTCHDIYVALASR